MGQLAPAARRIPELGRKENPRPLLTALVALRRKYLELAALRLEREAAEARGALQLEGAAGDARRRRARALARRFPGALRQLEGFTAQACYERARQIQAEVSALRHSGGRACEGGAFLHARRLPHPRRLWIRVVLDFHDLVLVARADRQRLRVRGSARYARIGLMAQIWQQLAQLHGLTPDAARLLVMGRGGRGTQS